MEVLQWARQHGAPGDDEWTCAFAVSGGQLAVLQWLRDLGRGLHSSTIRLNVSTFCGIRWVHDFPQSMRQGNKQRCDQHGLGCAEKCTSVSPWLRAASGTRIPDRFRDSITGDR